MIEKMRSPGIGFVIAAVAFLSTEALAGAGGNPWGRAGTVVRLAAIALIVGLAVFVLPRRPGALGLIPGWPAVLVAASTLTAWVITAATDSTIAAWVAVVGGLAISLWLAELVAEERHNLLAWALRAFIGLSTVFLLVAYDQTTSRFSDEEFFAALEAGLFFALWLLLATAAHFLRRRAAGSTERSVALRAIWVCAGVSVACLATGWVVVHSYQASFFAPQAPTFPGISEASPILCSTRDAQDTVYDGHVVHGALLAAVEANPRKESPELGMLALGTAEARWAEAFRERLLEEAAAGLFTTPANSVKSTQYQAALRAYYFPRVSQSFPTLFTADETKRIGDWFAQVNRRAFHVEWVDWLYGLAFGRRPQGPYLNQDNGAGLLALLESGDLAAPELRSANEAFLRQEARGWARGFRVTDDAFFYQPEWITNAYFQSLYSGDRNFANVALSFEWLLAQALPDGTALGYNHPAAVSLAGPAYLGAELLRDGRYLWLSGRALEAITASGGYISAQPGAETALDLRGSVPQEKSCLVFGDSGLPTQAGPLAPDKIVLRSGWDGDSLYLLANLRFSGWHRYKATGTVSLVYRSQPLAIEDDLAPASAWLPLGRSLFRDKRIPRENLNGLLIERAGVDQVMAVITSLGGRWAQDPPYYADVSEYAPGEGEQRVQLLLPDWHGWQHERAILFYDEGIVVVVDDARGPSSGSAALAWHLPPGAQAQGGLIVVGDPEARATFTVLPLAPGELNFGDERVGASSPVDVRFTSARAGELHAVSLFLTGTWAGAQAQLSSDQRSLQIVSATATRTINLPQD